MHRFDTRLPGAILLASVVMLASSGCAAQSPAPDEPTSEGQGVLQAYIDAARTAADSIATAAPEPEPTVPAAEPAVVAVPPAEETAAPAPAPAAAPSTAGTPPASGSPVDASLAGLSDSSILAQHGGGTFDEDGGVLQNVTVDGDLTITGTNQTLRNVRVTGKLQLRDANGTTVEHSELGTMSISASTGVVVRSVEIVGQAGEDGIHVTSGRALVQDLLIEGSRIHSPQVTDGSHYDGIQVRGVEGLTLRGNSFELGPWKRQFTAAVFLEDANGGNRDVLIEGNYIDGGGYAVYLYGTNIRVVDNVFGPNARWGVLFPDSTGPADSSGNVGPGGKPVL